MADNQIIEEIQALAKSVLPSGSSLWLYGSRARGDAHEGSDWDLLILLDKDIITASDYDVTYPFRELGWEIGEEISPHLYSKQQWEKWTFLPYYKNIEHDKLILL
ncbi:MAG: nucleotidyltransferase domain-containing protein [Bacteroidales bacterium]|nr:nucleotidyltransferase domain-containing protein [Bacteroidales bacterium]